MAAALGPLWAQFGSVGYLEVLIAAVVVLLLFGHRLPSVMRSLGRGMIEFKKGLTGEKDESESREPDTGPPTSRGPSDQDSAKS